MKKWIILFALSVLFSFFTYAQESGVLSGNCEDGYGEFRFEDGNIYKGNWLGGDVHGYGTLLDEEGEVIFEGVFWCHSFVGTLEEIKLEFLEKLQLLIPQVTELRPFFYQIHDNRKSVEVQIEYVLKTSNVYGLDFLYFEKTVEYASTDPDKYSVIKETTEYTAFDLSETHFTMDKDYNYVQEVDLSEACSGDDTTLYFIELEQSGLVSFEVDRITVKQDETSTWDVESYEKADRLTFYGTDREILDNLVYDYQECVMWMDLYNLGLSTM